MEVEANERKFLKTSEGIYITIKNSKFPKNYGSELNHLKKLHIQDSFLEIELSRISSERRFSPSCATVRERRREAKKKMETDAMACGIAGSFHFAN